MKPHIYKHAGLWYCENGEILTQGIGYTPAHAYADWKHTRDRMRCAGIQ